MDKFCENCGYKLNANDKFCENCGSKIEETIIEDTDKSTNNGINNENINHKGSNALFCIIGIIVVIIIVLGVISIFSNQSDVTIDNVNFNMVKGFKFDAEATKEAENYFKDFRDKGLKFTIKSYTNIDDEEICIIVIDPERFDINNINGVSTSINGHDGKLSIGKQSVVFWYTSNGKVVSVTASDTDRLKKVII
jgi:RNA polymerase subunit RPABC4/transcription elongation factor Spt4